MIRYLSTRGGGPMDFADVMLSGLAADGGLYVPDRWPVLDRGMMTALAGAPYADIAGQIMRPFIGGAIAPDVLGAILDETYHGGAFGHSAVAPLVQVGPNAWLLELFHGPTLSFKDYALQFIGRLYDHILQERGQTLTIIGATSGDTGSAAIEACRHCRNINIFILHPHGRTSEVQRRQMTSVDAPNVFNIAVEGTFDDCQALVKTMLGDAALRAEMNLSAVNSINWARIMAQTVYYTYAAIALGAPHRAVSFTVPTGNFGNVYAAWAARMMGLPLHRLTVASNRNDILTRFFESGEMIVDKVEPSLSPSMDIQVSSNFERYLFDLLGNDSALTAKVMRAFSQTGRFTLPADRVDRARRDFNAERCSDDETLETMRECYEQTGIVIDPHTAVGLHAAMRNIDDPSVPSIILACAHPAKFPDAVEKAIGLRPALPPRLGDLMERAEKLIVLPNDAAKVTSYIRSELSDLAV